MIANLVKQIRTTVREGELISPPFRNKKKHARWKAMLRNEYYTLQVEIDTIVAEIMIVIQKYEPLQLLRQIYLRMCEASINSSSELDTIPENARLGLLLLYVQNVISSSKSQITQVETIIKEEEIKRLQELHELMQDKIVLYHICAEAEKQNKCEIEKRKLMFLARVQHNAIAGGKQHQYLIPEILSELLKPHNSIFKELFGVTTQELVEAIRHIQRSLIKDLVIAGNKLIALHQEFKKSGKTLQEFMQSQQSSEISNAFMQFGGYDLHDLQKITNLPQPLLEELSLSPGEDTSFLSTPNAGWSTKPFSSLFKPFIKVNGRYYCFHIWNLTDNIYRALYKAITKSNIKYQEEWNKGQVDAVEGYAFELLKKILPKAEVYKNVYYYIDQSNKAHRYEGDGLIFLGDHLLIIEVKAGKYSQKSFYEDTKKLVGKGYDQGVRLYECLERYKSGVQLFNAKGNMVKEIKLSDYKHITICCITLEQLIGADGNLDSLKALERKIELAKSHIWLLSLDDLVAYSKLIPDSITFCNFLEKRNKAFKLGTLQVFDELCHYGAYLKHNDYAEYFTEISKKKNASKLKILLGDIYKRDINTYFDSLLAGGEPISKPLPEIHPIVRQDMYNSKYNIQNMPENYAPKHVRADGKIGKNAICPCGSGNKYKKCHGF